MAQQKISAPKGVSEYMPPRSSAFEFVREALIEPARAAGYQLIELPAMSYQKRCTPSKIVVGDQ